MNSLQNPMLPDGDRDNPGECQKVCIVTGLSGAGKSTALRVFEDLRYFSVDGLPALLAPDMAQMMRKQSMRHFRGIAMCMDLRQENFLEEISGALQKLRESGFCVKLIFLEADNATLVRRYAATRRPHPLERKGLGLECAIIDERELLAPLRDMASLILDSSGFSIHDLRRAIQKHVLAEDASLARMRVNLLSFGFKYGIPNDADFVFDLRFLTNPYFVEELRPLSGKDAQIVDYIFREPLAIEYRRKLSALLLFVLSAMQSEGRYRSTVAFGCTGGRHRSVAMVEEIAGILREAGYSVTVEHKNLDFDIAK